MRQRGRDAASVCVGSRGRCVSAGVWRVRSVARAAGRTLAAERAACVGAGVSCADPVRNGAHGVRRRRRKASVGASAPAHSIRGRGRTLRRGGIMIIINMILTIRIIIVRRNCVISDI